MIILGSTRRQPTTPNSQYRNCNLIAIVKNVLFFLCMVGEAFSIPKWNIPPTKIQSILNFLNNNNNNKTNTIFTLTKNTTMLT